MQKPQPISCTHSSKPGSDNVSCFDFIPFVSPNLSLLIFLIQLETIKHYMSYTTSVLLSLDQKSSSLSLVIHEITKWTVVQKYLQRGPERTSPQMWHLQIPDMSWEHLRFRTVLNVFTLFCGHTATPPLAICDIKSLGRVPLFPWYLFNIFQLFRVLQSLLLIAGNSPRTLLCLCVQKDVASAYGGCVSVKTDCPELPMCSCPLSAGCAMLSLPPLAFQTSFLKFSL